MYFSDTEENVILSSLEIGNKVSFPLASGEEV